MYCSKCKHSVSNNYDIMCSKSDKILCLGEKDIYKYTPNWCEVFYKGFYLEYGVARSIFECISIYIEGNFKQQIDKYYEELTVTNDEYVGLVRYHNEELYLVICCEGKIVKKIKLVSVKIIKDVFEDALIQIKEDKFWED